MGYPGSNLADYFPHELIDAAIEQIKKGEVGAIKELIRKSLELNQMLLCLSDHVLNGIKK
jgi:hypothetical protein